MTADEKAELRALKQTPWPADGLERVPACPVCQAAERTLLHEKLWDSVFRAAPGEWTLWRCAGCRSAYLDPRPDRRTIGAAYARYYTHGEGDPPPPVTRFQKMRAAWGNGYRNARYGTARSPASSWGKVIGRLFPPFRYQVDVAFRYQPRSSPDHPKRVLDIGCGGGEYLLTAREAGWEVAGADPDPVAQSRGAAGGLDIRLGSAEAWADQPESFDLVTMSHVIEHVHEPAETLDAVRRLLKPGGTLFIDTPNIDALGHAEYGPDWRGLECPRHLVIFNRRSLKDLLLAKGFTRVRYRARVYPVVGLALSSQRMAAGIDPYDETPRAGITAPGLWRLLRAAFAGRRTEFLTVTCEKPE